MTRLRTITVFVVLFLIAVGCSSEKTTKEVETLESDEIFNGFVIRDGQQKDILNGTVVIYNEENWKEFADMFLGEEFMSKVLKKYENPFSNFEEKAVIYSGHLASGTSDLTGLAPKDVFYQIKKLDQKQYVAEDNSEYSVTVFNDTDKNLFLYYVNIHLVDKNELPEGLWNSYKKQKSLGNIEKGGIN